MPEQTRTAKPRKDEGKELTWEQARDIANADRQRQESQRARSRDCPSAHTDEVLEAIDEALEGLLGENETEQQFLNSWRQHGGE